jgi:hypothetical protein
LARRDRLDTRLLVVRDDRHRVARPFVLRRGRRLLEDFYLAIDAQRLGRVDKLNPDADGGE